MSRAASTVLCTGATSFVGSHLMAHLLQRGHRLLLPVRGQGQLSPTARIDALLRWHGVTPSNGQIRVVEAQIAEPRLGLDAQAYDALATELDEVLHCASETSFVDEDARRCELANVRGTANVVQLARDGGCKRFHHMSTAYVAGRVEGPCAEVMSAPEAFNNAYEATKNEAERLVSEQSCPTVIYRPSIIYGDSRTGRTLRFNALYYPMKTLHYLAGVFRKDLATRNGKYSARMGVHGRPDGRLHMPLRVEHDPRGHFDIVPIDHVVEMTAAIWESGQSGIFHIAADQSAAHLDRLLAHIGRYLAVDGLEAVAPESFQQRPHSALERLFDTYIEVYKPFTRDLRRFDMRRAREVVGADARCPELDYDSFARCIDYAIAVDWGARSEPAQAEPAPRPAGTTNKTLSTPAASTEAL
jgi:nucleoside-diphosphate-sugar epimerase